MATKVGHITRKPDKMYFVEKHGDVMETSRNTKGGKKGRHFCKPAKPGAKKKPKKSNKIARLRRKYGILK